MSQSEFQSRELERRIVESVSHKVIEMVREEFVSKADFAPVVSMVKRHDRPYRIGLHLLIYIGALATFQFVFGDRWMGLISAIKNVASVVGR